MKHSVLFLALGLGAAGAFAQEVGQVISATPIVQQVQVPRQVCQQGMVSAEPQTSGGGGLVGAIAGTALGSTIGGGSGKAAAIVIGALGGALIGNQIESNSLRHQGQMATQCTTQVSDESRTVAYNVTYEYAGRQYTVQMPHDPGPTVQLQVRPVGALAEPGAYQPQAQQVAPPLPGRPGPVVMAPPMQHGQPVLVAPAGATHQVYPAVHEGPPVVVQQVYPISYAAPVYRPYYHPPVGISLNLGYSRGWRHRH